LTCVESLNSMSHHQAHSQHQLLFNIDAVSSSSFSLCFWLPSHSLKAEL
jgi:hypothetical protein